MEKTDFEDMLTIYPESIQAISSFVGRGWGVNYMHRSKACRMSIPQNNTSYDGIYSRHYNLLSKMFQCV